MNTVRNILMHPVVKSSATVFAGSMAANLAGWLYHLFVGRILGAEAYGELAALLSLFYIVNVPSSVIQTVFVKYFSTLKAKRAHRQAKWLIRVATEKMVLLEGIGLIAVSLLSGAVASFLRIQSAWYVVWLYLIFATFLVSIVNASALQGFQLFTASSVLTSLGMALRLVVGVPLASFGVGWVLVGNIFSNILNYGFSFIPLRFFARVKEEALTLNRRDVTGFSLPALMTVLGTTLLFSQDVLFVKHYFSAFEAGIYASLSVLGKVLFYATGAVSFVLFPVVAERNVMGRGHLRLVFSGLVIIATICLGLSAVYFALPQLVVIAFGHTFSGALPYMGRFAIFMSFFSLSSILAQILLAVERMSVWIIAASFAVAQAVLLAWFHDSLSQVILVNILVSAGLFFSLLLYYGYGTTKARDAFAYRSRVQTGKDDLQGLAPHLERA